MCGLVGYVEFKEGANCSKYFDSAINSLQRRGPDSYGKEEFISKYKIRFGHRRLSILDLSKAGTQPMTSFSGRYKIIFNGEIYNHIELRDYIKSKHNFNSWKSYSDTETLLNLFEFENFKKALQLIEGMFAISLFDSKTNTIFLSRDPMGEKPLYVSLNNQSLLFGSDLEALTNFSSFNRELSLDSLGMFFKYNYIPAPNSIYSGTYKCPAGKYITINLDSFVLNSVPKKFNDIFLNNGIFIDDYWSSIDFLDDKNSSSNNLHEASERLESILSASIKKQLISDVPIGAFLSGGIDSSLIAALMQKESSENIKTFTVGFKDEEYDESQEAKKISSFLGTDHTELIMSEDDVLRTMPDINSVFSEPFADPSQIPTLLLSKLAKHDVSVALSGDGADELFGGYDRYINAPLQWKKINRIPFSIRSPIASFMLTNSFLNNILSEKLLSLFSKIEIIKYEQDLFENISSGYDDLTKIFKHQMNTQSNLDYKDIWLKNNLKFEEKMMFADMNTFLQDDILCKVDRASMSCSLEVRTPFLHKHVLRESLKMPLEYKIKDKKGKFILKHILQKHIPKDLTNRPKKGFVMPLQKWITGPLSKDFNYYFSDESLSHNLINIETAQKMLQQHKDGKRNWQNQLWAIYSFQNWFHYNNIKFTI